MATNLQRLDRFLKALDDEGLTKKEFVENFEQLVDFVLKIKEGNESAMKDIQSTFSDISGKLSKDNEFVSFSLQNEIKNAINDLTARVEQRLGEVRDGKDADEEAIIDTVTERVTTALQSLIPETPEKDTAEDVRNKLEVLSDDERLEMSAIKGLEEELEKIRKQRSQRLGGTSGDGNVKFSLGRVVKKETPAGAIDSANTDYTTTQDIHTVLSFAINGMVINDDEYTISGNTITMNSAIDSSLSGTSFRIVYV